MEILSIIPAREKSKGIKNKNLVDLKGKPLLSYVISAASKSNYITRIIVSTDGEDIKKVALEYGAEVPFLRPQELSEDLTPIYPVVKHALFWLKDNFLYSPELIVILQPTSPFLLPLDIDSSIQMLLKEEYESVVSITEAEYSPYWMVKFGENNRIEPIINSEYFYLPYRQGLPKAYRLNGAIYATFPSTLEKYPDLFHPRINMGGYIMPQERSFDINTEFDLNLARAIINVFSLG